MFTFENFDECCDVVISYNLQVIGVKAHASDL